MMIDWLNGGLPDALAVLAWGLVTLGGILGWERLTRERRARRAREAAAMEAWEASMKALPASGTDPRPATVRVIPAHHPAAQECPECGDVFAVMDLYAPQTWRSPCGHVFWLEPLARPFVSADEMRETLR